MAALASCTPKNNPPAPEVTPAKEEPKIESPQGSHNFREIGTVWNYDAKSYLTENNKTATIDHTITRKAVKTETVNNIKCVVIEALDSRFSGTSTEYIGEGPEGIYVSAPQSKELVLISKPGAHEGDAWEVKYPALIEGGMLIKGTAKRLKDTTITTPLGEIAVEPVEITVQKEAVFDSVIKETAIYYLSRKVGVVMLKRAGESKPISEEKLVKYEGKK